MFGAIATCNGVPRRRRPSPTISTHEGALHEQHRASRRVDAAAGEPTPPAAAAAPAAGTPPPPSPGTVPAAAAARRRRSARRGAPGRRVPGPPSCSTGSWPG